MNIFKFEHAALEKRGWMIQPWITSRMRQSMHHIADRTLTDMESTGEICRGQSRKKLG
jgi:hypothetical protein